MLKITQDPLHEGSSEANPMAHDLTVRLDPARHRKLIQLANEHRLSPHDLVAKALDAFFAAHIK
jgi:hypothetical protein